LEEKRPGDSTSEENTLITRKKHRKRNTSEDKVIGRESSGRKTHRKISKAKENLTE